MKTSTYKYFFFLGLFGFLAACSTKKNNFVNRNYHAVTTEYNVLYNGNIALDKGVNELKTTYTDNFWEVLPVERMQATEEEMGPTDKKNPSFERAETKATKAIQKHSMNIGGSEKNPQIDEAHLLLGQARYYDNRFVPALEAFNYILYKYPTSDKIGQAKVWRAKTNIRLENEAIALKNLKDLLEGTTELDDQVQADANAIMAEAYLKTDYPDSAITVLKTAVKYTKLKEEKARYRFIIGQLYDKLEEPDSAYAYFQQVIDMKRKSPRRYVIQSHAMQAGQFDYKSGDTLAFMEKYRDLLEDRENRPFLDVLNYQVGLFYDKQDIDDKAITYYNKSLRQESQDNYLRASGYRNIGEIYFEDAVYAKAGMYYDSTMTYLDKRSREYKRFKKKRDNLADVIKYEAIAKTNDSILYVTSLPQDGKVTYYEDYIVKLKERDEAERERLEIEARKQKNMSGSSSPQGALNNINQSGAFNQGKSSTSLGAFKKGEGGISGSQRVPARNNPSSAGGKFYFYTTSTVSYGKLEFKKRWGDRPLADNWRWASEIRNASVLGDDDMPVDSLAVAIAGNREEDARYTPEFYIDQLPTSQTVLDSLAKERNFAYYQLGIIYKEKFKEYQRAVDKLEALLQNSPEERLILPSKYNLYKIYQIVDPAKAEIYKQQILDEYPDSRYAEIIRNPSLAADNSQSPEAIYASLFKKYEEGDLRKASVLVNEYIDRYTGEEIVSKFELLKARILGRLQGVSGYKRALNFVALTYPNSEEGKEAETLIKTNVPYLERQGFGRPADSWKIVFEFDDPNDERIKPLKEKIQQYIKDALNNNVTLTQDIYTNTKDFLVVHGFHSDLAAEEAISVLKDYKTYKIKETPYIISNQDYKVVQIKKNFTEFKAIE